MFFQPLRCWIEIYWICPFYRIRKIVSFFLKLDVILKLDILKLNGLLSIMVAVVVTMVIVAKG